MSVSVLDFTMEDEEVEALIDVGEFVEDEPQVTDTILRSYGMEPSPDPGKKALQLIAVSLESNDFDADMIKSMQGAGLDTLDFKLKLGGFKKIFGKIGGIFQKKEGGSKVGNFFKNLFKGKKKVFAEAQVKLAAGQPLTPREIRVMEKMTGAPRGGGPPPRLASPASIAQMAVSQLGEGDTATLTNKIAELEKKVKQQEQTIMWGGGIAAVIIIVMGIALWRANQ